MNRGALAMKHWRRSRQYNQDQAALRCGFSQTAWGRYELGERLPPVWILRQLREIAAIEPTLFFEEVLDLAGAAGSEQPAALSCGVSSLSTTQNPGPDAERGPGSFSAEDAA